ncbi:hypothetical protein [Mesorhizobium sp. M6A.T.Ce.TU.016.01.1.1]|uniref:hypothetical protein n=1 Tax=Mesorhizobium sp. M6A.T.Ce.TU.016.01.1.1 TaxID=2496783 RepID=UPI000FCBA035|nr:hypothetical protein [Mesorhizobium sp. M6A.T.Ce.TU.016.01.1.1]RUU29715.1 hypothetical protein EOC94_12655 [Mesorhizobium sp. M6A.T.Ce.TU.016.01.1.1]
MKLPKPAVRTLRDRPSQPSPTLVAALKAASHALRSYQYGNSATDLAQSTADFCDEALKSVGEAP